MQEQVHVGDKLDAVVVLAWHARVHLQDAIQSAAEAARRARVHLQDASRAVAEAARDTMIGMPSSHLYRSCVAKLSTYC